MTQDVYCEACHQYRPPRDFYRKMRCRDCRLKKNVPPPNKALTYKTRWYRPDSWSPLKTRVLRQGCPVAAARIILEFAYSGWGSLEAMLVSFGEVVKDPDTPMRWKTSWMCFIIRMLAIGELNSIDFKPLKPIQELDFAETIQEAHRLGKLVPEIRKLINNGEITLDQLDPPPADGRFRS